MNIEIYWNGMIGAHTYAFDWCFLISPYGKLLLLAGDNTEKIWAHRIFAKQKTDVPKARKMATGRLGSVVSPPIWVRRQSPQKVLIFFVYSTVKQRSSWWKYGKNISAIILFNLLLALLLLNVFLLILTYSYFTK